MASNNNDPKHHTNAELNDSTPVDEVIDTTGLLLDYLANWKWFVLCVIACLVGAYFYIATIVPTYDVKASLYLNNQNYGSSRAASIDPNAQLVAMKSYIDQTELEILKSRNNVIDIVDSLKMSYSYWRVGNLRDIPLYENNAIEASLDSVSLGHLSSEIVLTV